MKVYAGMDPRLPLTEVAAYGRRIEALGYDGVHVPETVHDPFSVSLLLAEHTKRITIRTAVALAFVRSPMVTAYVAWDLAVFSGGRFQLGLGTQIRQNVEQRFGMPWTEPVGRLREYVLALEAVYAAFRTGGSLRFEGSQYALTRLQPYFNPGPAPDTAPPSTWLAGVNAGVCRLAGELAAGFVTHPTNSDPRYLETICLPNLCAGAAVAGRELADLELVVAPPIATGPDRSRLHEERDRQRRLLAFLYSTPAYHRTLELYGWDELTDDALDVLVPTATYDDLAPVLITTFGHLAQGILVPPPRDEIDDERFTAVISAVQSS